MLIHDLTIYASYVNKVPKESNYDFKLVMSRKKNECLITDPKLNEKYSTLYIGLESNLGCKIKVICTYHIFDKNKKKTVVVDAYNKKVGKGMIEARRAKYPQTGKLTSIEVARRLQEER